VKVLEKIRVLIVDDVPETCENIRCLLHFDPRIEVVGEARDGEEAIKKTEKLHPDIILMDINMPVLDGVAATETISLHFPESAIIIMSVQGEQEYLRRAMAAGAREYIVKPFTSDELVSTIYRVYELEQKRKFHYRRWSDQMSRFREGKVVTVFSTKGGVGKTTIAVNLAVSLAKDFRYSVALVDLDLQFGDIAVMLNLKPRQTLSDLVTEYSQLDEELLNSYLLHHTSGIRVLAAPARPEYAEIVSPELVEKVINILKNNYDYVLIDTPGIFTDPVLVALDYAHTILFVLSLDLPTLKNVKLGLEVLDSLHHKDKVKVVLNRAIPEIGITPTEVEKTLGIPLAAQIPSDGRLVVKSVNKGIPFCLSDPQSRVAESIRQIALHLAGGDGDQELEKRKRGLRLFGRLSFNS